MRTIGVSTAVYAAIWAARQTGEESEDDVLRRLLNASAPTEDSRSAPSAEGGVRDSRTGVVFPEGFRVHRRYKGERYAAIATGGHWRREDTGQSYPSLNQLNGSIVAGTENVWNGNWKFDGPDGKSQSIAKLRR